MSGVAVLGEVSGNVPVAIIAPLWAAAFLVRFAGVSHAIGEGHGTMPWFPRMASWVLLAAGAAFWGGVMLVALAVGLALDAAAGFTRRYVQEKAPKPAKSRKPLWWTLALVAYLVLVAAFHVLVAAYLPFGTLVTWTMLALAFCFALRVAIAGPKAGEGWLRAPLDHRRHERREKVIVDPVRARADDVLLKLRARGDAGPFLQFVREAAHAADLPPAEIDALERRILASLARAGTRRDQDVEAALEEVERFLSLRDSRSVEVPS